jgi:ACS family sodium-dependent inorganic phosphate cotransporter
MAKDKPFISQRWLMMIYITLASALIFVLRYNMSVVIVAMVAPLDPSIHSSEVTAVTNETLNATVALEPTTLSWSGSNKMYQQALLSEAQMMASTSLSAAVWLSSQIATGIDSSLIDDNQTQVVRRPVSDVRTFDWDETTQGQILSSYFYGYLTFQVTGGRLCEKFGPKWILAAGTVVPGVLTWLTPTAAYMSESYLIALRVLIGAFHALVLSSCYAFAALWIPVNEKSSAVIWINIGFEVGGFVTLLLSGYISSQPWLGWEFSFYTVGLLPLIWFIPYVYCVYSTPESHPRLTTYERKLLEHSQAAARSCHEFSRRVKRIPPTFRWGTVLTSQPVWANVVAKMTGYFGSYLLATKLPAYMSEVHGLPLGHNGLFCAFTFMAIIISKLICLRVSPWLESKKWVSITTQRKIFQCGSQFFAAVSFLAVNFFADNVTYALTAIVVAMLALGMQCAGEAAMLADFAQDFTGTIFGFANTFTCLSGIVSPIMTGKNGFDSSQIPSILTFHLFDLQVK